MAKSSVLRADPVAPTEPTLEAATGHAPGVAAPIVPKLMYVMDTTATAVSGPRTHELMVDGLAKPFTFERGKPLGLPPHLAVRFLKHAAFKLTDENGTILSYEGRPKQPEELGAGEQLKIGPRETIARLDELSSRALFTRCMEIPGSEQFAEAKRAGSEREAREAMIAFIVAHKAKLKAANPATPEQAPADDVAELADEDADFGDAED